MSNCRALATALTERHATTLFRSLRTAAIPCRIHTRVCSFSQGQHTQHAVLPPGWKGVTAASIPSRASLATSARLCLKSSDDNTIPGSSIWESEDIKKCLASRQSGSDDIVFVDVREPRELYETGKIPGAINIPITSAVQSFHISDADFEDMYGFARPTKDKTLVFYCKAGVRAKSAAGLAQHAGWKSIGEYPGSWIDWEKQNGPVEKVTKKRGEGV